MRNPLRSGALLCLALTASALLVPGAHATPTWIDDSELLGSAATTVFPSQVTFLPDGTAVALWSVPSEGHTVLKASTRAPGGDWTTSAPLSDTGLDTSGAHLAVAPDGRVVAAWSSYDSATTNSTIFVAEKAADGGWTMPTPVSDGASQAVNARVTIAPSGDATVVWERRGSFRIQAQTRVAEGPWWSPGATVNISTAGSAAQSPDVAVDPTGRVVAVWEKIAGTGPGIWKIESAVKPPAGAWGPPQDVSVPGSFSASQAHVVVDGSGLATAIWQQDTSTTSRIQTSTRTISATSPWSVPLDLSDLTQYGRAAQLAADADGNVTAVWAENTSTDFPTSTYLIRTSTRTASGWSTAATLGSGVGTASYPSDGPSVAVSPTGAAVASWIERASTSTALSAVEAAARTAGGPWGTPTTLSAHDAFSGSTRVGIDADGDAAALWWELGTEYEVRGRVLDGAGPSLAAPTIPATGKTATSMSFGASATDAWSAVTSYTWDFGDGGAGSGALASHTYVAPGTYQVKVTATDAVGNSTTRSATTLVTTPAPPPEPPTPTPVAKPVLSKLSLTAKKIRAVGVKGVDAPKKTKLKLTLNVDAMVRVKVKAVTPGGLKRAFNTDLMAGARTITFSARVDGTKLPPGRYKVIVKAHNASGSSAKKTLNLRIVGAA